MTFITLNTTLYFAIALYGLGALIVLWALVRREGNPPRIAISLAGFALLSHTVFIGTICSTTGHPPVTNLAETVTFIAWVIMVGELVLLWRYKVQAAAFFVYPVVVLLLVIAAVVREPFSGVPPSRHSGIFIAHILLTTIGVAALLVALAFAMLYFIQERAIKRKRRGAFYDWIPSLRVCDLVSYRVLTSGFGIYTLGLLVGIFWSYELHEGMMTFGAKEIGALVAWVVFAALIQSHITDSFRTKRTVVLAIIAFASILVALFGIRRS